MKDEELLKVLLSKGKRKEFLFYLPIELHKKFKKACGDIPLSRVVQMLMEEFVERNSKKSKR